MKGREFLALGILLVTACGPDLAQKGLESGQRTTAQLSAVENLSYPSRTRVGSESAFRVTLRSMGTRATAVELFITQELFGGFILKETKPPTVSDTHLSVPFLGERRVLTFGPLKPGEEQEYRLVVVAKAAGEYPFKLSYSSPLKGEGTFSGRAVVLP